MVDLQEIAVKLKNVLNGVDEEIINKGYERPIDFYFEVQTSGFHLDHIMNDNLGKNFIPVFIDQMGGDYNPVPILEQASVNIPVVFYFPVRFKNDLYKLQQYLINCFVGQFLNYGTLTKRCISNISVCQYGEIQNLDLKQFQSWVANIYQKQIDITEPFISMQFSLYLTNANQNFIYGNSVKYQLEMTIDNVNYSVDLIRTQSGTGYSNSPVGQQLIDTDDFSKNTINISNYSKSIMVYPDISTEFWRKFIKLYNEQKNSLVESVNLIKTYDFGDSNESFTTKQIILSINENEALGDLISYTFTFGDSI